ncbi:MAG: HPr family phosphocarrier protein [Clostridia bacterium]|nr:HPr family phosphocarrier protein [Clostridia bacterium]
MITFRYTIGDKHGIHARPAGILVNCAKRFSSDIKVEKDGKTADAKRLLSVMSLAGKHGEELTFTVHGSDEALAAEELERCCHENIG